MIKKLTNGCGIALLSILLSLFASGVAAEPADDAQAAQKMSRYYPKQKYPPGFYEGALLISFLGGKSIAPNGGYIRHEKKYDQMTQSYITSGAYINPIPDMPNRYFTPEYIPQSIGQMDIEYGGWEHFGMGLSLFQYSIDVLRQDSIPNYDGGVSYYEPFPTKKRLYKGNSATFLTTYHPFSRSVLDPYVAFRAGFTGYTGEAHSGLLPDPYRTSDRVRNGIGMVVGGGLGINVFLKRNFGIKLEGSYYHNRLKSDLFSERDLNSYHAQIGVFVNYASIAAEAEDE